jgi:hypothetical protein
MSNIQFSGQILDALIAPEFSSLSSFSLPEVPELPNFFGSLFLNEMFQHDRADKVRPLIFSMIRHLACAIRDYREARRGLVEFGNAKQQSSNSIACYLRALNHFEQAVIHCDLSVGLSHAIARCYDNSTPKKHFFSGDDSPEERLRFLYNALKHFDASVVEGRLPDRATPIWIVQDGLKGVFEPKRGRAPVLKTLLFTELSEILRDLVNNAEFLAEEVYRIVQARRAARAANSSV